MSRRLASLSLDLDNLWSYLKAHGDCEWKSLPSYLHIVVPRILEFLKNRDIKITFFVVGQDAILEDHRDIFSKIVEDGHEIGNHSFHHEPWLHLYSQSQLVEEFDLAEKAIYEATGQTPRGFRGPGFSFSNDVLNLLSSRGYQYDASTFPTFLGPLARAYYFFKSSLSPKQKQERKELFGKLSDGFRPNKPFLWEGADRPLLEIPVTTMPLFKFPIHASYLLYLASFSQSIARAYFWTAITMCRSVGVEPSILLHPTDFLDVTDAPQMGFFPAMKMKHAAKLDLLSGFIGTLESSYQLVPMGVHAERCLECNLNVRVYSESDFVAN